MDIQEKDSEKLYYSIGEVAAMFKVNTSLIRFWEKEFDILKPHKSSKGNRLFTQKDVDNLFVIYHLVKEKGMTLQGAKDALKNRRKETFDNATLVQSLQKVKDFLLDLKSELKQKPDIED